ncbi:single-stranded-DNA-specific exonuclease RecJ [Thermoflexus sp.]|jgi:single-stranded-DNA-specific exonuclease|uniref:single-stranded-DNA-specific exonuclease RecJ n=1 Tax=Thermoflexus sp. TaxID=1969742 RepID=UPI00260F534D|nr:single-stranded-DNA-specific exonuclease RecJ [Thermoflexus sp.]
MRQPEAPIVGRGRRVWRLAPPAPEAVRAALAGWPPLLQDLLYHRGITSAAEAAAFQRRAGTAGDPFRMKGMIEALDRLERAIRQEEPIAVYGDYDVDGVTATAMLVQALQALGARVRPYIPHRETEGYGLNGEALRGLAAAGVRVVISVDCGARAVAEAGLARELGLELILTDHHLPGPVLPPALLINPRQPECPYPFKDLAGVGVAFRLVQALKAQHPRAPFSPEDFLDLVALGTVADMVPLLGENRGLVAEGLERLRDPARPGLRALCEVAGLEPSRVDPWAISFILAPRLNAAGRLEHAQAAYRLLTTSDPAEARAIAEELDRQNRERQALTQATEEAARALAIPGETVPWLLFAASEAFRPGVVGLAAGRLAEAFYRPAVIVSLMGEEGRGSARSIPEFHITQALDACADLLIRHGGHAAAAGFVVRRENLERLRDRLMELAAQALSARELQPALIVEAVLSLQEVNWQLYEWIASLEPYGYGNPAPRFLCRNAIVRQARTVGNDGQHLRMVLTLPEGGPVWDAIAFRQGDRAAEARPGTRLDLVFELRAERWNGEPRLTLHVEDFAPAS